MKTVPSRPKKNGIQLSSIIFARCPSCNTGKVLDGGFAIRSRCPHCDYNFHPEPGFYVGAIAVGFLLSAMAIIPPMIMMKILEVDIRLLMVFPFIEFIFVGSFLMFYCRIIWLHLQYRINARLDGSK